MKHLSILLSLLFLSSNVFAAYGDYVEKPFSIGIGSYVTKLAVDDPSFEDSDYSGYSLSFGYVISNNIALRATYFSTEDDDVSDITSKGYDLLAHFGTGFAKEGFKAYIGGGFFKDKQEFGSTGSETFDGLQLNGGIGYNWEVVSLDLIIGIRDSSDYEKAVQNNPFTGTSPDVTAVSGSLLLSFRF